MNCWTGAKILKTFVLSLCIKKYSARTHKQWLIILWLTDRKNADIYLVWIFRFRKKVQKTDYLFWPKDSHELDRHETQNGYFFCFKARCNFLMSGKRHGYSAISNCKALDKPCCFQSVQIECYAVLLPLRLFIFIWVAKHEHLVSLHGTTMVSKNLFDYFICEKSEQQVGCLINCFLLSALHVGTKFIHLLILSKHNVKRKMTVRRKAPFCHWEILDAHVWVTEGKQSLQLSPGHSQEWSRVVCWWDDVPVNSLNSRREMIYLAWASFMILLHLTDWTERPSCFSDQLCNIFSKH